MQATPPGMVAEEVKLLRNLVARWFFLRTASSHSLVVNQSKPDVTEQKVNLPVEVICISRLTAVLLVKFWQACEPKIRNF